MAIPGVRAHDYGTDTPANLFSLIAADGWQTMQLALKKSMLGAQQGITGLLVEEVKQALDDSGLSVGVLGAYVEPSLAEDGARQHEVDAFCTQIPIAATLGAGCVGTETTAIEKQPGVSRRQALTCLRLSLAQMLQVAEQHRVTVAIEPVFYHVLATPEETMRLLDDMRSPWLRVIFDPVNLLSPELAKDQHALWQRALTCFGGAIAAVHVKGVRREGGRLAACPLEESIVDYEAIFAGLRQLRLPHDLPVLREQASATHAAADLAFLKALL